MLIKVLIEMQDGEVSDMGAIGLRRAWNVLDLPSHFEEVILR